MQDFKKLSQVLILGQITVHFTVEIAATVVETLTGVTQLCVANSNWWEECSKAK